MEIDNSKYVKVEVILKIKIRYKTAEKKET